MGYVDKINIDDFNFDNMIEYIRPNIIKIQEYIQNKKEKTLEETKELLVKALKVEVRRYLQQNYPKYISITDKIVEETYSKMYGLGYIDKYLAMEDVTDVFVFGKRIMYIKNGTRCLAKETFTEEEVKVIYKKIASNAGRNISTQNPSTDAELLDGSRVLLIIEPEGAEPYIAIRKHTKSNVSIDNLKLEGLDYEVGTKIEKPKKNILKEGSQNINVREYMKHSILERKNIIFVGGTGSGKTTFMSSLTYYVQKNHIVAVLEDTRELSLPLPFVYYLKTRAGDATCPPITYVDILRDCLRANPDRIMLTEIRTGESAYSLLQVLNSGHKGSMTSIHANGALEAIDRLEELVTEYKNIPKKALRGLISKAVDVIVYLQLEEDENGNKIGRAIKEIIEIKGLDRETEEYEIEYIYYNK